MSKYKIKGIVEHEYEVDVEADSEKEAKEQVIDLAHENQLPLGLTFNDPEFDEITLIK